MVGKVCLKSILRLAGLKDRRRLAELIRHWLEATRIGLEVRLPKRLLLLLLAVARFEGGLLELVCICGELIKSLLATADI